MRWRLNLLSMSDEAAFSLGASLTRERVLILTAAVAATAASVALAGIVGWVGLIVPHIARRIVGVNARYALPCSDAHRRYLRPYLRQCRAYIACR